MNNIAREPIRYESENQKYIADTIEYFVLKQ